MHEISTIGIDIAKHVLQLHGADEPEKPFYPDDCAGARWPPSLPLCRPVSSALRPAAPRTSGRERSPVAGMTCA